jgi:hypothetical protein
MFSKIASVRLIHYNKQACSDYFHVDVYYEFYNKTHRFITRNLQLAYNDIIDVCIEAPEFKITKHNGKNKRDEVLDNKKYLKTLYNNYTIMRRTDDERCWEFKPVYSIEHRGLRCLVKKQKSIIANRK